MSRTSTTSTSRTTPASVEYPEPIPHGAAIQFHHNSTDLYEAARSLWYDVAGEAGEEGVVARYDPDFLPGEVVVVLSSSRWKAGEGTGEDYTAYYQYNLKIRYERGDSLTVPPVSLSVDLMPQKAGMVYPDGNDLDLPNGEGTMVKVQTTYPDDGHDVLLRGTHLLARVFGEDYDRYETATDTFRIIKAEAHVRFDVDLKRRVIKTIDNSRDLIDWGGRAEVDAYQDRVKAGWIEAGLTTDRWDLLGYDRAGYREFLKCYQASDWEDRPESDPLHHPKLEAAYAGRPDGNHPSLDEWDTVMGRLQRKVAEHARHAGIEPSDLVADEFFDGPDSPTYRYTPTPEGRRDDLRAMYDDLGHELIGVVQERDAAHDVLEIVARQSGATYDQLVEETGLARRTVRYHVRNFVEAGILKRVGNPVVVVFAAQYLLDKAEDVLESEHAGETTADRIEELQERAEERRERRESDDQGDGTDDTEEANEDAMTLTQPEEWRRLDNIGDLSPVTLSDAILAGPLVEADVKVRNWDTKRKYYEPPDP